MSMTAQLVLDSKAFHGEGPVWDEKENKLYWIDGLGEKIHQYDLSTGKDKYLSTGQCVGCIVLKQKDGLIAAMHKGIYSINFEKSVFEKICDPESNKRENRFNDGKCDALGRLWAGTMYFDGSESQRGSLYKIDFELNIRKVIENVSISNGIAWDKNNKTMYYIDTPTMQVVAYEFDIEAGEISNPRVVVTMEDGEGIPDGMTIDCEGMLWVAHWGGYKVSRWNPNKCEKIDEVNIPVKNVSCCTFGGNNLDELYITTAIADTSEDILKKYPLSGGVFKVKPGVKGELANRFGI